MLVFPLMQHHNTHGFYDLLVSQHNKDLENVLFIFASVRIITSVHHHKHYIPNMYYVKGCLHISEQVSALDGRSRALTMGGVLTL